MKKYFLLFIVTLSFVAKSFADEGMWLPQLLATLNEKEMKKMGMKISAADIYNISKGSLKDAIVSFGGFCTAEVISDKGLLLTNHHCGFDAVQNHSSIQNNYIRDGFWAYNNGQELQNPGLFATFIISINEVTVPILNGVTAGMSERERQSTIDKNINEFKKTVQKESYQDILIRPFFDGNKYFIFITETYKDVRLVGAPPSSIGNFGKDTDNWMWPRHTGDFSMFRIYAGKDNKPADYSPDNVPYKPKRSLSISLDGMKEGDFTMVFGFPGRTMEYLPSAAVAQTMTVSDPAKIGIREKALQVLNSFMRKDEQIKIQYAAKYATIENAYKKWKGEVLGLKASNAVGKKQELEAGFEKIVLLQPAMNAGYVDLLKKLNQAYADIEPFGYARDYYNEIIPKIELFTIATNAIAAVTASGKDDATYKKTLTDVNEKLDGLFGEYNATVDQKLFEVLMEMYVKDQKEENVSPLLKKMLAENGNSFAALAKAVYSQTVLTDPVKLKNLLTGIATGGTQSVTTDVAAALYADILKTYVANVSPGLNELQANINQLQRTYMQAQMDVFTKKVFYPDANSTLRLTYGNVKGYNARDAVKYDFYTYLDGVMEKYKPGDYEFDVPQKLIDLYNKKDFGPYGVNGRQPVCFIAANHTTGGNSGSPALDGYGNLVGLNFDRVWEGTMSDINYDKNICRNIMVDIRYVLFIVDKFAGAKNIISELKLVSKKK
ncbi:S46 family peptidase [Ferruginibacter sp. SUN106]|uniref:S46 family peptidase n=1 Tax=Ferruginibacter sp. SUN106 TaxID=2978348 RepID=UPI003D362C8F